VLFLSMEPACPAAEDEDAGGGNQHQTDPQEKVRAVAGFGKLVMDILGFKIVRFEYQKAHTVDLHNFGIILGTNQLSLQFSRLHALRDLHIQLDKLAPFQIDLDIIRGLSNHYGKTEHFVLIAVVNSKLPAARKDAVVRPDANFDLLMTAIDIHPLFLAHNFPKPLNFLSDKSSEIIFLVSFPQFLKTHQGR